MPGMGCPASQKPTDSTSTRPHPQAPGRREVPGVVAEGSCRAVMPTPEFIRCTLAGPAAAATFTGLPGPAASSCSGPTACGRVTTWEVGTTWGRFNSGDVGPRPAGYPGGGESGTTWGAATDGIGPGGRGKGAAGGGPGTTWGRGPAVSSPASPEAATWASLVSAASG